MADKLIQIQEDIAGRIDKAKTNFKKSPKDRVTLSYVETRLETLEETWLKFTDNHNKMLELVDVNKDENAYFDGELYSETEEIYTEYKALLKETLSKLKPISNSETKKFVKLPEISIPKFSGKYSEWANYKDLFTSLIHNNSSLDDVQKLHYLKGSLVGEAEGLVRNISVTAENYKICWDRLDSRYSNKRSVANSIIKRLLGQKALVNENANSIRTLLDTTRECLQALRNVGVNTSHWDVLIIHILSQKLDPESRSKWEVKSTELDVDLPTLVHFEDFLEKRFRSLEYKGQTGSADKPPVKGSHTASVVEPASSCSFCNESHKLSNCKQFAKESTDGRRSLVQSKQLCFNCLNPNHSVYRCNVSTRCRFCKKKHHTLLHPKESESANESAKADKSATGDVVGIVTEKESPETSDESSNPELNAFLNRQSSQVLLATAMVGVVPPNGSSAFVLRSLLDQGSQASFITESAEQMLGLAKISETRTVSGLGGSSGHNLTSKSSVSIKITSRCDPTFSISVKAHVLDKLTMFLPSKKVMVNFWKALPTLKLADATFDTPSKIDLLLGAEVFSQILQEGLIRIPYSSVIAQQTRLGWILSGTVYEAQGRANSDLSGHNVIVSCYAEDSNELLKRFWELESDASMTKGKQLTAEDQKCEEIFTATTQRDDTGRYIVRLPFKSEDPLCKYGGSKQIAIKQFLGLERRLLKNPSLHAEYSKVLNEYLSMGHMEEVPENERANPGSVYLPHHAVVKADRTTTKVRVVFNASCTGSNGASLNGDLMVGPALQPELRHLVMSWRRYPISLVADIVKMYRQVKMAEEDADYQRIVWREDPNSELRHFRHLRVTFGTSSAPYLAVRALQQVAHDEGSEFPLAATRVLNEFYMDDLMSGCHSVKEGIQVYEQMTEMLGRGGFPLQKWSSSNQELLQHITKDTTNQTADGQDLNVKVDETIKILGLCWSRSSDEFQFKVKLPSLETPVTKRRVISDISRLFDPLGWVAPVITTAKVMIQRIWLSGVQWDEAIPEDLRRDWVQFRDDLSKLAEIHIPRWMDTSKDDKIVELHGFSDASNVASAAVVYERIIDKDDKVHVKLIASKTRVAPIKQVSIPRLELCGAVLLARLINEVADTLQVQKQQIHAWTDSTIVLAWLRGHPNRWKTFVANRVSEILTTMDGSQWSHVASQENPADCASRGIQPAECVGKKLWFNGPGWLQLETICYDKGDMMDTTLEEKKPKTTCFVVQDEDVDDSFINKFSSLVKLTRVLSFCRRVLSWKKDKATGAKINTWLTAKEINESLHICIKICQKKCLKEDIESLQKTGMVCKKSKLSPLNPYLDEHGVLRVGGRLHRATAHEDLIHPIIIPHASHLTDLLIRDAHARTMHGGPQLMLNYLRSKYWIIGAKNLVRKCVHNCVVCVRHAAKVSQQLMGQLPPARVTAQRPFHRCGVDYAGPISVKTTKGRGHHSTKGYICLFVCMSTKAIHLEMVSDMTSDCFLAAFKRLVARRGHVAEMWSDNGTTFVGAAKELKKLFDVEKSKFVAEIADYLATNGTEWHFIPPHAPNFGGLWEAGVKSTKHHLKRVIGDSTLTFEEMTTVLAQIEACLNSRPLSQLSNNSSDACSLTPAHFLVGEPLVLVPELNYENSNLSSLKRWNLTQRMVQDFWRRWSQEYLTQLHQRYKWKEQTSEPKIGDIVLVKEDGLPPTRWLLGRVLTKYPGLDNITRVVSLKCDGRIIKRPICKLIVLPTSA